jgi:transcriptional regulator with XRE-family HTH domain
MPEERDLHVAHKFERLIDAHRRPDGSRWTGQKLEEATEGLVPRSYFTNLLKGRIESPGYEKMLAIANAMGFPPALWFEDSPGDRVPVPSAESQDLAARVERLFQTIRHPRTGEPYTEAEVARMTLRDLSEEDVEGIRAGRIADPTVGQVAALAAVFGVPPSYLMDRGRGRMVLDEEALEALSDGTACAILSVSARLPERERCIVLGIVRQFENQRGALAREEPSKR